MRRAGVDGETARTIVGHKTASMQRRYQIVDGDEKAVALNQVQAYLKGVEASGRSAKSGSCGLRFRDERVTKQPYSGYTVWGVREEGEASY